MRYAILFSLFALLLPTSANAQLAVSKPANDTIINSAATDVGGTGVADGTQVSVTVNGTTKSATAANGRWNVAGVSLARGDNIIRVQAGNEVQQVLAVRSSALSSQGVQRVFFDWDADVDEELRKIARGTITAVLDDAQLASFVARAKARTQEVYAERYGPFGIEVVAAAGPDVHTVHMTAIDDSLYGSSPEDCGSADRDQTSTVHVGTYRNSMVNSFGSWKPMKKTDSLDTRIEDVGQALGRTTTHETGHSLGLTASSGTCRWMKGCVGWHNCESYDTNQVLANRFDSGRHIMDPGGSTFNRFRIAEPSSLSRAATRRPSIWEPFGRSYLTIVHPEGGQ